MRSKYKTYFLPPPQLSFFNRKCAKNGILEAKNEGKGAEFGREMRIFAARKGRHGGQGRAQKQSRLLVSG